MGISKPFTALATLVKKGQAGATITPAAGTPPATTTGPLVVNADSLATPFDARIAALRRKVDALTGRKPRGIDAFKFALMRWGAAILPLLAAVAVGDVVATFFISLGFHAFSSYLLAFVLELVTMLLTYAISHAFAYRIGKELNVGALVVTCVIWLLFLAAQIVLLVAIGGVHPGSLIFIAIVLRSMETGLACTASAIVAYWTREKSVEEELALMLRRQAAFRDLHAMEMESHRSELRSANEQRQEEQHLETMQRSNDMLVQIGEKIGSAVLKVVDQALAQIEEGRDRSSRW